MAIFTLTGATGSVGKAIVNELLDQNHEVRILTTRKNFKWEGVQCFYWNPSKGLIDLPSLDGADYLIHLAGATVSKRWTTKYKQEITDSRVQSTQLLLDALEKINVGPRAVVSASAIGIYGSDLERSMVESDPAADDYLASVTRTWEMYTQKFETEQRRSIQLRIGIVLDGGAGVLGQLEPLAKLGLASPLGTGKQWTSWIHVKDLARMFIFAATHEIPSGPYNAVGPEPLSNKALTKTLTQVLKRPMWLPAVPGFVLKLVLGEMATLALMSQKVSNAKITAAGFTYVYPELTAALNDIYSK
jgi:uncharacterized protein (TIGR01777 family)